MIGMHRAGPRWTAGSAGYRRAAIAACIAAACVIDTAPASSASPPSSIAADRTVPFHVGEVLTYDVGWSGIVSAGRLVLSVRERRALGGGRAGYYCLAEAKPASLLERFYRVYYKADAVVNTTTLLPSLASLYKDENGSIENHITRFTGSKTIEYEQLTAAGSKRTRAVPPSSIDMLSAVYQLRSQNLKAGQPFVMNVINEGGLFHLQVAVTGPESIKTALGTVSAWRLTPTITAENGEPAAAQDLTIWISTDARRLPVRFQAGLPVGSFTLTLSSAK